MRFPRQAAEFFHQPRQDLDHAVDLGGLERVPGRTFRWSGVYAPDFSTRTTLDTQLNVFQDFRPKLPAAWTGSASRLAPIS